MIKNTATATLLAIALVMGISVPAHAVTTANQPNNAGQALEIAPPIINLSGNPGETIETKISLRDVSTTSLRVTSELNDFTANGEDGTPKILLNESEKTPYSLVDWVSPIPVLNLKPKQIENLPVKITIPKNAAPGGYYGVVRFTATPPDMNDSGVSLSASLGTLILLRVKGDAKEQVDIEEFYTSGIDGKKSSLFEGAPFKFSERVKNTGNIYEQPTGRILITDIFGKTVAAVNVNLEQRNVLPGTTRKFEQEFNKEVLGDRFLFGLYNAKLSLQYGDKQQTTTSSLSFWIIPYKLILLVLLIVAAVIVAGRILLKRYTDRVVGKSRGKSRRR